MIGVDLEAPLSRLWTSTGGPEDWLQQLTLDGVEPALPSSFRVGTAAQASIAAAGLSAALLHEARGGRRQRVRVDMDHAVTEFRSEACLRIDGRSPALWDDLAGTYRCGDGRWVRVHTVLPHHRERLLELLGCEPTRAAVAAAVAEWGAAALEDQAAATGAIVAMMRSRQEWEVHPQSRALTAMPVVAVEKIGEAPVEPLPAAARPLSGVRVLDLTRIIAGPVAGRTLAAHGADVLLVSGAHLPCVAPLVADTGRGKLSCHIDLRDRAGVRTLETLVADCDLFVQGYRPGAIVARGFSPHRVAGIRPGVVYVSLSAYGPCGPWAERRGFDSIVQTACGINAEEARAHGVEEPRALPCQALDHASGYLMAFGAMMGLHRRLTEGGSWHVQVALARTGAWLGSLGSMENGLVAEVPSAAPFLEETDSGFGRLTAVRHAAELSETPAHWARPSVALGTHPPRWPPRWVMSAD